MDRIRIGIVGAGGIVKSRHLPGIARVPEAEVAVVCNRGEASTRTFAEEFGVASTEPDWKSLVQRDDLDVVWIGAPPALHAPVTLAALAAGKHVFCQARMALNVDEARAMLAAAEAHPELVTMLCPPPFGMTGRGYVEKLLADGFIGTPLHFAFRDLNAAFADPAAPPHWRQRKEISGDNTMAFGIYLETLSWWLGFPEQIAAQARVVTPKRDGYAVEIPEILHVTGRWPGGVLGSLEWSAVARHAPDTTLELYGSEGTLVYNFTQDKIYGAGPGDDKLRELPVPEGERGHWTVEEDFLAAVKAGGGRPEPSFATGVRYMEATSALHQSAREGKAVALAGS